MIKLRKEYGLILCSIDIMLNKEVLHLKNVLVDTGSATTLINSNFVALDGSESIRKAYGVGGYETILKKNIDEFKIDKLIIKNYEFKSWDFLIFRKSQL